MYDIYMAIQTIHKFNLDAVFRCCCCCYCCSMGDVWAQCKNPISAICNVLCCIFGKCYSIIFDVCRNVLLWQSQRSTLNMPFTHIWQMAVSCQYLSMVAYNIISATSAFAYDFRQCRKISQTFVTHKVCIVRANVSRLPAIPTNCAGAFVILCVRGYDASIRDEQNTSRYRFAASDKPILASVC